MHLERAHLAGKGWLAGAWNSDLEIAVGYADRGIDEPHFHSEITEVYMVARGASTIRVGLQTVELQAGDLIVIEPGEAHTFLASSTDYFHFVIHSKSGVDDKHLVEASCLGV